MTKLTDTTSAPQVLTDSRAFALYLLQHFTDQQLGATGALLLNEYSAPLGILILEHDPGADLAALPASLADAATQIIPFLFRPAGDPVVTDEEIKMFCDLLESPARNVTIPDCLYVWSTGNYLSRSNAGRLACIDEPEGEA